MNIRHRLGRRAFIMAAAATGLLGCTNGRQSGLNNARAILAKTFSDKSFTIEDVERLPVATIGVRLDNAPEALVALAEIHNDDALWIAADHTQLITRNGRILRLIGLNTDTATIPSGTIDPVADGTLGNAPTHDCVRVIDFMPARRFGLIARSTIKEVGTVPLQLLYKSVAMRHFVETGECAAIGWRFENEFMVNDADGKVWGSTQHVTPDLASLTIRTLRPYSGAA